MITYARGVQTDEEGMKWQALQGYEICRSKQMTAYWYRAVQGPLLSNSAHLRLMVEVFPIVVFPVVVVRFAVVLLSMATFSKDVSLRRLYREVPFSRLEFRRRVPFGLEMRGSRLVPFNPVSFNNSAAVSLEKSVLFLKAAAQG